MRIDRLTGGASRVSGTRKGDKASSKGTAAGQASGIKVSVADASTLREKAMIMFNGISSSRMAEIEAVRARIEHGEYEINQRQVAAKIVCGALIEEWM